MGLQEKLNEDLRDAMRSGDEVRKRVIRSIKSAISREETSGSEAKTLNEEAILNVITREAKQRRESIAEFERAGRSDLIEQEQQELAILESYLPRQLSEEEIRAEVKNIVAELNATDMGRFGEVMKNAMARLRGQADGKIVQKIVREMLSDQERGPAR